MVLIRNTPAFPSSITNVPTRGSLCRDGHSTAKLLLGTAVCQIVVRSAMLAGFSQYVRTRVRGPPKVSVRSSYSRT